MGQLTFFGNFTGVTPFSEIFTRTTLFHITQFCFRPCFFVVWPQLIGAFFRDVRPLKFQRPSLPITLSVSSPPVSVVFSTSFASQVSNTYSYTTNDWSSDITNAQSAGVDAFVLNIGAQTSCTNTQLTNAYGAAEQNSFKPFLSFDYAAQGAWSISSVVSNINAYKNSAAQFKVNSLPLVSTFEDPDDSGDWPWDH